MNPRVERIKSKVTMVELLFEYGYLQSDTERKQQFRCDLHGDTLDERPSARVYPEDNHAYCFACGKSRDVISWTMEKEDLDFSNACRFLERRFGLEPWQYTPKEEVIPDVEPDFGRVEKYIRMSVGSGAIPFDRAVRMYGVFDQIHYLYQKGEKGQKIQSMLDTLKSKVLDVPEKQAS